MSGTSTFELPHYVTDFQEIWRWWIYITGYKSALRFCPYQFTLTPALHTSQIGLTLKFPHTHTHKIKAWNNCLYGLDSTKYIKIILHG